MTHYLRELWQDPNLPVTGPKPKARRTVGVLHYSGSNSIPSDKPGWLRSMQADYVNNRGYSLGYGHLVDAHGNSWEIRGDDFNMASNNGDKVDGNANDWTLSILLDVTTTSAATPAQIETCKDLFANAGITVRPVPHSFYDYTSCCGDTVRAQIDLGLFDPGPDQPPEDEVSQEQIDAINARLDQLTTAVNDRQATWNQPTVGNPSHENIPAAYLGDIWDVLQNISARLP